MTDYITEPTLGRLDRDGSLWRRLDDDQWGCEDIKRTLSYVEANYGPTQLVTITPGDTRTQPTEPVVTELTADLAPDPTLADLAAAIRGAQETIAAQNAALEHTRQQRDEYARLYLDATNDRAARTFVSDGQAACGAPDIQGGGPPCRRPVGHDVHMRPTGDVRVEGWRLFATPAGTDGKDDAQPAPTPFPAARVGRDYVSVADVMGGATRTETNHG